MIAPSFTEFNKMTTNKEEEKWLTLDEKIAIVNDIYPLILKKKDLDEQWTSLFKKRMTQLMLPKILIQNGVIAGTATGSALALNYVNQYITPEKYQPIIHNLFTGIATVVSGLSAIDVAQEGIPSLYSLFTHGNSQQILNEMNKINEKTKQIEESIKKAKEKGKDFLFPEYIDADKEKIYQNFMNFYNNNHGNINIQNINVFFLSYQNYSIEKLLELFKQKKINSIISLSNIMSFTDITVKRNTNTITKMLIERLYNFFSMFDTKSNKEHRDFYNPILSWMFSTPNEDITKGNALIERINTINSIIHQLSDLKQKLTSQQNSE